MNLGEKYFGIYGNYFGLVCAIYGLYRLLGASRESYFWSGFFVGIFWFYWISFSLIYVEFAYLIPVEIAFIGIFYGFIFLACGYFLNLFYRWIMLILINYIHPLGFNWLNLSLFFVNSPLSPNLTTLASILGALILLKFKVKFSPLLAIIALVLAFWLNLKPAQEPNLLPFQVELVNTDISQHVRWDKGLLAEFVTQNLRKIDYAIARKAEFIVFPESAFPMFLDHNFSVSQKLLEKSQEISILAGALGYENGKIFNSAYLFANGEVKRLDKVVLVPFGEEIPLPKTLKKWVNQVFFDAASDFSAASEVSRYKIGGETITNAICYEATKDEIYVNSPKFVVAITNNSWFLPSTEPILQKMLLKYYAYRHKTTIYHAVNGSRSEIITP